MNSKRILVIPAIAVLAVFLSVSASFLFPNSSGSTQIIPVTGSSIEVGSPFYQNGMQNQAAVPSIKVGSPFYQNGMQNQAAASSIKVGTPFYQNGMQNQGMDNNNQ